jgi:hypothetical protein
MSAVALADVASGIFMPATRVTVRACVEVANRDRGGSGVALRAAGGLFNERVEAGQPPVLAEVAYGGHVGVGVAGEEFYDVRTRLRASGVELQRNQVRQRHDPQAASGTDDRLGRRKSAFDNRRQPSTVVHDLNETE